MAICSSIMLLERLTANEVRILWLMADGKNSADMAQILGYTIGTVKNYRSSLGQKLGAQTAPHIIAIAFRLGLLK